MKHQSILRRSLSVIATAALLASTASTPAAAQRPDPIRDAVGRVAVEYWQPRLSSYKSAIDRSLNENDLRELDRLRVRWSIMVAEQAEARAAVQSESGTDGSGGSVDMKLDLQRSAEIVRTMEEAQAIAARYPSAMSEIGRTVINDFQTFIRRLPKETDRVIAESGVALPDEEAISRRQELGKMAVALGSESSGRGLRESYTLAFEPIVLLYNGSDLRQMIAQTPGTSGFDGSMLPEASLLSQNHPNPASSSTTIDYTLKAPATAASIRIFDAAGTLVMTLDEGARPEGTHSRRIDVSQLPSGSYLYQLVIVTAGGEQVFARLMRVVR